jgi:hypothetical protein
MLLVVSRIQIAGLISYYPCTAARLEDQARTAKLGTAWVSACKNRGLDQVS